jgi:deoxyribose-phosphate aldolase
LQSENATTLITLRARQILSLIDLTRLSDTDSTESITQFCDKALAAQTPVAAICIYPQFVKIAAQKLKHSAVKLATVVNFPHGDDTLAQVLPVIARALNEGATEIDVVFPYKKYMQGATDYAKDFIRQCKNQCGPDILLKVILETGALPVSLITVATSDMIAAGADFIKTSTGKINAGATLEAATLILTEIKRHKNKIIGFKASGGIREIPQAITYLDLANDLMGADWISPRTFRFGASHLFEAVMAALEH